MTIKDVEKYKELHNEAMERYDFKVGDLVCISYHELNKFINSSLMENWYYTMRSIYSKHKKYPPEIITYNDINFNTVYNIIGIANTICYENECCVKLMNNSTNKEIIAPISVLIKYTKNDNRFNGFNNCNFNNRYPFNSTMYNNTHIPFGNYTSTYLIRNKAYPDSTWMKVMCINNSESNGVYKACINGINIEFVITDYLETIERVNYNEYSFLEGTTSDPIKPGDSVLVKFNENDEEYCVRSYHGMRVNSDGTVIHFVSDKENTAVEVVECKKYMNNYKTKWS